ncbi:Ubiquitin-like-specific protease 2 [Gracilariopsis chorda]|uniref:Ubiquitin-like-specific protease 2 n=1 Tax=Gracilariopsis chorda TaxID=448386 RepID=A0A2V3J0H8_9FLOR|nr:Ubiquitin-like-specific protease 2 [Gracilariopsis chorda]|eukprot:PXF47813.1 Ubiquitin-like-specific protease 2 [Gracilariopsis chorda]
MSAQHMRAAAKCDSDDDVVVAVDGPPKRPFSRISKQRPAHAIPSMASEVSMEKNGVKQVPLSQPVVTASIDSDDSVYYPGSSLNSKRARRAPRDRTRARATGNRRSQQQHTEFQGRIHTLDSSSDSDHLRPTHIIDVKNSSQRRTLQRAEERSPERPSSTSRVRSGDHDPNTQSEHFVLDRDDKSRLGIRSGAQKAVPVPRRRSTRRTLHSVEVKNTVLDKVREDRRRREGKDSRNGLSMLSRSAKQRVKEEVKPEPINVDDYQYDSEYENGAHRYDQSDEGNRFVVGGNSDPTDSLGKSKLHDMTNRHDAPQSEKELKKSEVVSLDQKEAAEELKELNRDAPYSGPTHLIFEYPPQQRGKIRVTAEERARLQQRRYLNDSLIDFFFKYQEIALKRRTRKLEFSAKFFSSFFFGRLRRTKPIDYEGVKSWTKNVDLFANKFVFVPICESYHWSLIIVANLDKLDRWLERDAKDMTVYETPRIIYLDSLDPSRGSSFGNTIRRYLVEEWLCRKLNASDCEDQRHVTQKGFEESISILKAKVPIQTNEYDCGLYVLNSLLMFLKNESGFMDKLLGGEDNLSDVYTHVDIQILRHRLIFLMDQFEEHWSESRGSEVLGTGKDSSESERVTERNNEASDSQPNREVCIQEDRNLCRNYEAKSQLRKTDDQRGDYFSLRKNNDQRGDYFSLRKNDDQRGDYFSLRKNDDQRGDYFSLRKNESSSIYWERQDSSRVSQERRGSSNGQVEENFKERKTCWVAEECSAEESHTVAKVEVNSSCPVVLEPEKESLKCDNATPVGNCDDSEYEEASAEAEPQFHSGNGRYEEAEAQDNAEIFENRGTVQDVLMNHTENNAREMGDDAVSNEEHLQAQIDSNRTKAIETEVEDGDASSYEIELHCDTGFSFNKKSRKHPLPDKNNEEQATVQSSDNSSNSPSKKKRRCEEIVGKPLGEFESERQFEVGYGGGRSRGSESRVGEDMEDGIDIFDQKRHEHDPRDKSPVDYDYSVQAPGVTGDAEELHTVDHIGETATFKRTNKQ